MTPDEERRRLDGLFASYGQVMEVVARLDERIGSHDRELQAAREQRREDVAAMTRAFERVDESCGKKVVSVKADFHEEISALRKTITDAAEKAEARRERNEWTLGQRIALASATLSPLVAAVALVLK
jgi:hypothetical protein